MINIVSAFVFFAAIIVAWTAMSSFFIFPWQRRSKNMLNRVNRGMSNKSNNAMRSFTNDHRLRNNLRSITRAVRAFGRKENRNRLNRAGFRSREAGVVLFLAKLSLPVMLGIATLPLIVYLERNITDKWPIIAVAVGVIVGGFWMPDVYLINRVIKRRRAIQIALPDCLDMMVICAEAGLSLDAALNRVSSEMKRSHAEMADELALTAIELSFLPERRQALENLAARIGLPSVRGVVSTLAQTEKYGTPLSHSLRVLSSEFREERMLKAEEKAARLPAMLTVPMIVFILPTLFIVIIGPALLDVYDNLIK